MITNLRERPRLDTLRSDQRGKSRKIGQIVYLGLLGALLLFVANSFIGPMLYFKADGLVVQSRYVVASPFSARISTLYVKPGQKVHAGDLLLELQSHSVLRDIASLTARQATLVARKAELTTDIEAANLLLPLARTRVSETRKRLQDIRFLVRKRLVSNTRRSSVEKEHLTASQDLMRLRSRLKSSIEEKRLISNTLTQASKALKKLKSNFHNGQMYSPYDGFIGSAVPNEGEVVKPGNVLLNVFTGAPSILAYIPTGRFYEIRAGDRVNISNGFKSGTGHIEELLPVAGALPAEFQKTFQPRGRNQIARITIDPPSKFALFTKVSVSSPLW